MRVNGEIDPWFTLIESGKGGGGSSVKSTKSDST